MSEQFCSDTHDLTVFPPRTPAPRNEQRHGLEAAETRNEAFAYTSAPDTSAHRVGSTDSYTLLHPWLPQRALSKII